ncbi:hypothetical protein KEM56_002688 [Ascosphaera pollenicola]|nr:hypothetical protein KEM56_002688 [Ascosphaera pollenicola]
MSDSSHHSHSSSNGRESQSRENRPLRYYTVSYSHSQGRNVVRPDGVISDGEEMHDQIRRATQSFLAKRAAPSSSAAAAPTNINAPPVGSRHYHCRARTETTVGGADLPPRSRPVAVSLPGDISVKRYISNHRANKTSPGSSSGAVVRGGGAGDARNIRNGHGHGHGGSASTRRSSPLASCSSDDHNMMFTMDEDAENDSERAIDPAAMTQSFTSITSADGEDAVPYSLSFGKLQIAAIYRPVNGYLQSTNKQTTRQAVNTLDPSSTVSRSGRLLPKMKMSSKAGPATNNTEHEHIARNECLKKGAQHVFRYVSRDAMEATIYKEASEAPPERLQTCILLGFICVPSRIIEELDSEDSDNYLAEIVKYTDTETQIILFQMPGTVHESAVESLKKIIEESLTNSGLGGMFIPQGSVRGPARAPGKKQEPDVSFFTTAGRTDAPQIVGEVATTQPAKNLEEHARYWLDYEEVRLVLTVEVRGERQAYHVCQWNLFENGALATDAEIVVSLVNGRYEVTSSTKEMVTEFCNLLDRDPVPDRGEKNFSITGDQIVNMANFVELAWQSRWSTNMPPVGYRKRTHGWGEQ